MVLVYDTIQIKKVSSFVIKVPLHTSSEEEMVLRKIFWAARQQYNVLLGEALKRVKKVRSASDFKIAHKLYKKSGKSKKQKRYGRD